MIRPRICRVTSRLPKKLPPNSLITLGKTGEVTQVTKVTGKYNPIGREVWASIGVYFPGFGLPGYLSPIYIYNLLINIYIKGDCPVTVSVTSGNFSGNVVTGIGWAA